MCSRGLIGALPLEVAFKNLAYRLVIAELPASVRWQLQAQWAGGYWLCAHAGGEEALRATVYGTRSTPERATVARTIFERLVREGGGENVIILLDHFGSGAH